MSTDTQLSVVYFEAKPKRGRQKVVDKAIWEIMDLFAEVYDHKANCSLRPERGAWGQWKILMTFESEADRDMLTQELRFQELLNNIRVNCKRANRLRRLWHSVGHPGEIWLAEFQRPIVFPKQKQSD